MRDADQRTDQCLGELLRLAGAGAALGLHHGDQLADTFEVRDDRRTFDVQRLVGCAPVLIEEHHPVAIRIRARSEEHTSELQSLMRISYAVFCLKKKNNKTH